ncbi:oxidoreductase [Saccharopolyspora rectivirgula]|jgi:NAD(P)-dependent dehydrogenase (short-subunit alcohol dehydrogenase family)|uniref:Protochlorophyllide oxidoreductase n=1 Tax=Saccharopolyspora rectivirgula TaxID=28042 RepID=A0A073AYA9_9PSEU|nr:oxidoreductase [Saccharopolyspora rectivirgula]KEI44316.1 protochlorophyllide oxidoreductase [Saccharopolyspora rectivirgula]
MPHWTAADIPDQSGRTALITGANSGLGLTSAKALAARGARVLLACRSPERGRAALHQVAEVADTRPELVQLDLADLSSVRAAADEIRNRAEERIDVLLNNAGVMATPKRTTRDGFELQIGTNHFGHAALTWLLLPAMAPGARVVTVSSLAHWGGSLDLTDLNFQRRTYRPMKAYSQSKLANLLFALQLDRAAREAGRDLISVCAHPGISATELGLNSVRLRSLPAPLLGVARAVNRVIGQNPGTGALPQLHAATAPDVRGGDYFGPGGPGELRGHPERARRSRAAQDVRTAERLWQITAELTGIEPPLAPPPERHAK